MELINLSLLHRVIFSLLYYILCLSTGYKSRPFPIPTNQSHLLLIFFHLYNQEPVFTFPQILFSFLWPLPLWLSAVSHKSFLFSWENPFLWPSRSSRREQASIKIKRFLLSARRGEAESSSFSRSVMGFGRTRLWLNDFYCFCFRLKRGQNSLWNITVWFLGKSLQ